MQRLETAEYFTNPPLVAEIPGDRFVLMDGSNRHMSMRELCFEHILVQVADYESEFVELGVWQHVVSDWDSSRLLRRLRAITGIDIRAGGNQQAVAQMLLHDGPVYSIHAGVDTLAARNDTLRQVVEAYHQNATLYRTPLTDPGQIWNLYSDGIRLGHVPALSAR